MPVIMLNVNGLNTLIKIQIYQSELKRNSYMLLKKTTMHFNYKDIGTEKNYGKSYTMYTLTKINLE